MSVALERTSRLRMVALQHTDMPEIEKEVKMLFRQDNEAIDVKWEVVIEDDKSPQDHTSTQIMHGQVTRDTKRTCHFCSFKR